MRFEVGSGHLSAGEKCSYASSKSKHNQRPSKELDDARDETFGIVNLPRAAKYSKQFLRTVTSKEKPNDDTNDGIDIFAVLIEPFRRHL